MVSWHELKSYDNHIMDYTTRLDDYDDIGTPSAALINDYINKEVWNMPNNRIAIVRRQNVIEVNMPLILSHTSTYPSR